MTPRKSPVGLFLFVACCALALPMSPARGEQATPEKNCSTQPAVQAVGDAAFDAADRLAVINLINSYGYFVDNTGAMHLDELFTADANAALYASNLQAVGVAQYKATVQKRHDTYQRDGIQRRHVVSAPRFDYQDAHSASGEAYLQYYETKKGGLPTLGIVGWYSFRAIKTDGRWKFACWIGRPD